MITRYRILAFMMFITLRLAAVYHSPEHSGIDFNSNTPSLEFSESINFCPNQNDSQICLELAMSLEKAGDIFDSIVILNQFIIPRELNQLYDQFYTNALYQLAYLYVPYDSTNARVTFVKAQKYDQNLPEVKIENGCLIAKKMSKQLDSEEAHMIMNKMFLASGICESIDDIKYTEDGLVIKMKCGCCCLPKKDSQ